MSLVEAATSEGVARITLHSPPANCYSYEMMQALDAAISSAVRCERARDRALRCR